MAFHPDVILTLSALDNQERVRDAAQDRLAASAEARARRKAGAHHGSAGEARRTLGALVGTSRDTRGAADRPCEPSQAVFHQQWQIYRTMVEENYLFHREAYACLHRILLDRYQRWAKFKIAVAMSWRSERIPSKNMMSWSLKKTTGSIEGRPRAA